MSFFIRPATTDDVDAILRLIIELAIYEKEPDAVKATPEILRRNIFESRYGNAIVAVAGSLANPGEVIGMAIYFFNFSTWTGKPGLFLEDLYVSPDFRKHGVGKALFGELGKIAQEKDCPRLDWNVLKWNQPAIDFYEKRVNATMMSEWVGMRLETEGIENLRNFRK